MQTGTLNFEFSFGVELWIKEKLLYFMKYQSIKTAQK